MKLPSDHLPKGLLKNIIGDATIPQGSRLRYILQIVNNEGKYGAGFSGALSKRYPKVESSYRQWWRERYGKLQLGDIQIIQVASDIIVINMVAQDGVVGPNNLKPIRLDALQKCLAKAGIEISEVKASVHAPKFGGGLAGADFDTEIMPLIDQELLKRGINVTIYSLE